MKYLTLSSDLLQPWVEIFAPVPLGQIFSKPWCLKILISVRYVFFPWTHCFFFLSTIALVKCIYGLNEAFCTKTRDKILSKKFLNLILRILCYPDLLKISAAILLFRKAQGKCHFERESPYDRFSSLFLGCICTFEVFILVFLYFVILYLQFFQLFFPESPGKMPLRTREPIWQVF